MWDGGNCRVRAWKGLGQCPAAVQTPFPPNIHSRCSLEHIRAQCGTNRKCLSRKGSCRAVCVQMRKPSHASSDITWADFHLPNCFNWIIWMRPVSKPYKVQYLWWQFLMLQLEQRFPWAIMIIERGSKLRKHLGRAHDISSYFTGVWWYHISPHPLVYLLFKDWQTEMCYGWKIEWLSQVPYRNMWCLGKLDVCLHS